ncbi:YkgJ family cysteine cluster protein [Trinickia sp. NRRL B-1857]|uniref:YkgJ family cysteine cluster protein n=1 Tax=Trinickia sp. NRRL B-1857 TaxID=3162879 RepID=UPI003D2DCAF5
MATTTHFACTLCGKCCHDLKLPLSVDESLVWLERGGTVQVLTEAIPWPAEPAADNGPAWHKRRRSFAAKSGVQPIRVIVTLVAAFDGPCPHLGADMRCAAYERRPRVCRMYPAEVNPYVRLAPVNKACPPEAWALKHPVLEHAGRLLDAETVELIRQSRDADAQDQGIKERLVASLGYSTAALSNEGYVVYAPRPATALEALRGAASDASSSSPNRAPSDWTFISGQPGTIEALLSIEAKAIHRLHLEGSAFRYLG